jgi:hypothetical protein
MSLVTDKTYLQVAITNHYSMPFTTNFGSNTITLAKLETKQFTLLDTDIETLKLRYPGLSFEYVSKLTSQEESKSDITITVPVSTNIDLDSKLESNDISFDSNPDITKSDS